MKNSLNPRSNKQTNRMFLQKVFPPIVQSLAFHEDKSGACCHHCWAANALDNVYTTPLHSQSNRIQHTVT